MTRTPSTQAFRELLRSASLSEAEAAERLAWAIDPDYWRSLSADGHIDDPATALEGAPEGDDLVAAGSHSLREEGYFAMRGVVSPPVACRLNAIVDAVVGAGWPAAFASLYDEFWLLARLPAIASLVRDALGPRAVQLPTVWLHVVRPVHDARGWPPHIDGDLGMRDRITAWMALTDATVDTACMYLIPRDAALPHIAAQVSDDAPIDRETLRRALAAVRPLPAAAGDVLGWQFDIVHWGGPMLVAGRERRAISFEFAASAEAAPDSLGPVVHLEGVLPAFDARLRAVAAGLLRYGRIDLTLLRFAEVSRALIARVDRRASERPPSGQ